MKWFEEKESVVIKHRNCIHPSVVKHWCTGSVAAETGSIETAWHFILTNGERKMVAFEDIDSEEKYKDMFMKVDEFLDNITVDAEMSAK